MKKLVALSIVSAMTLTLGACAKTDDSANAADNATNEVVAAGGNFAENVTSDNAVVADNAADTLNAAGVSATNTVEANVTNTN